MPLPRLLLIDDEPALAAFVAKAAEMCGFDPVIAEHDQQFRDYFLQNRPKMVVLDPGMPGMDGVEVCRKLDHEVVKVVMLTARDDPALEQACREAGADAFLTKPFSSLTLLDIIEELSLT